MARGEPNYLDFVTDATIPNHNDDSHPRHEPGNGTGGQPGTHDGHADAVPQGLGYASRAEQSPGNAAAQQSLREAQDSGRAYPPAAGTQPPPVAQ